MFSKGLNSEQNPWCFLLSSVIAVQLKTNTKPGTCQRILYILLNPPNQVEKLICSMPS